MIACGYTGNMSLAITQRLYKILHLLFPIRSGIDFSLLKPDELYKRLPQTKDKHGATALAEESTVSARPPLFLQVKAVLAYKNRITRSLIWNIKFKKDQHAFQCGGYVLYQTLLCWPKEAQSGYVLIPMPVSKKRRHERGYNQCELLTRAILAYDTRGEYTMRTDILLRKKHIAKQTFQNRQKRLAATKDIFEVARVDAVKKTVIVIDDVITTGSTMREAIISLQNAGYRDVYGLGLAH